MEGLDAFTTHLLGDIRGDEDDVEGRADWFRHGSNSRSGFGEDASGSLHFSLNKRNAEVLTRKSPCERKGYGRIQPI
jgi:hypothetical protein